MPGSQAHGALTLILKSTMVFRFGGLMVDWLCCPETGTNYYSIGAHPGSFGESVLHKRWCGKGTRLGGTRVVAVGLASIAQAMAVIERQRARAGYSLVEQALNR